MHVWVIELKMDDGNWAPITSCLTRKHARYVRSNNTATTGHLGWKYRIKKYVPCISS